MNFRTTILGLALAAAAAPAAFANNFVGGELGYDTHPVNSTTTRAQLQREYQAFRAHPVLSDGTVFLQGETGYVSPNQGVFVDRDPAGPHTHVLGNAAGPRASAPAALSEAEQRAYRQQYIN
jgi:hypothetical protein